MGGAGNRSFPTTMLELVAALIVKGAIAAQSRACISITVNH